VLGHAHLGKGVVEVALGDYNCDGSFQLYDIESVKTIMTHEIGHSIGLPHTNDKESIMYPSYTPSYAYCLFRFKIIYLKNVNFKVFLKIQILSQGKTT
jgi:Matrixin.